MSDERNPDLHLLRFIIAGCVAMIATVLTGYIWTWVAVVMWVLVGAYAVVVLQAAIEAAWKASR